MVYREKNSTFSAFQLQDWMVAVQQSESAKYL